MEFLLAKKPADEESLDLVNVECAYSEARSAECTAPAGYKCPYKQYKMSLPKAPEERFHIGEKLSSFSRHLGITPTSNKPRPVFSAPTKGPD